MRSEATGTLNIQLDFVSGELESGQRHVFVLLVSRSGLRQIIRHRRLRSRQGFVHIFHRHSVKNLRDLRRCDKMVALGDWGLLSLLFPAAEVQDEQRQTG